MEIILREAIDKLGHAGDIVKVKDGYARNFLLPRRKAYVATPGNIKVMEQEKAKLVRREAEQRTEAEKLRELLNGVEIRIERKVGEQDVLYGSVTSSDIADALDEMGLTVDKRKILVDQHIKQIGQFVIPIRLFTEVTAEITLHVEPEGGSPDAPQVSKDVEPPDSTSQEETAPAEGTSD